MAKARKTHTILIKKPIEYFKDLVTSAMRNQNINVFEFTEYYVVNLLSDYVYLEKMYPETGKSKNTQSLGITMLKALKAHRSKKIKYLKYVGDFSLFISGFFSDSLSRRPVDIDYYKKLGSISYSNLSLMMKDHDGRKGFHDLYSELSVKFQHVVDVIAEVSETSNINTNRGLLRIYDRWLKTGSQRDELLLKGKGLLINNSVTSDFLQ